MPNKDTNDETPRTGKPPSPKDKPDPVELPKSLATRRGTIQTHRGVLLKQQVFALRMEGKTYDQIGTALGISSTKAAYHCRAAMQEETASLMKDVPHHRSLMVARIERLMSSLWPYVTNEDPVPQYVDRYIKLLERLCKILGLDSPTQIELSGPAGGPLQAGPSLDLSRLSTKQLIAFRAAVEAAKVETVDAEFSEEEEENI